MPCIFVQTCKKASFLFPPAPTYILPASDSMQQPTPSPGRHNVVMLFGEMHLINTKEYTLV